MLIAGEFRKGAHVDALLEFFGQVLAQLPDTYQWPIPHFDGFAQGGERGFAANVALKQFFHERWRAADRPGRVALARDIVGRWGGIHAHDDERLGAWVDAAARDDAELPFERVASYSKVFSIARPDRFAIYDSRVAACLNAVQLNRGVERGVAFRCPPGRQRDIVRFARCRDFRASALRARGWRDMARDASYRAYLDTLHACRARLPGEPPLHELEMALFASAPAECVLALERTDALLLGL